MKLTGQCKTHFEEWLNNPRNHWSGEMHHFNVKKGSLSFNDLTRSMKWGVYVDFFEDKGIDVDKIMMHHYKLMGGYSSKYNCRESAIEKSNQDYNAQ